MTERSDAGMSRLGLMKLSGGGGRLRELEEAGCHEHDEQRGRVNEKLPAAGGLGDDKRMACELGLYQRPKVAPARAAVQSRTGHDIGPVETSKMDNDLTRIRVAEYKPRIALVRAAAIGFNRNVGSD